MIDINLKFRYEVLRAQAISREFLDAKKARLELLVLYWDKIIPQWWQSRKEPVHEVKKPKEKKGKSKIVEVKGISLKISEYFVINLVKLDGKFWMKISRQEEGNLELIMQFIVKKRRIN